MKSIFHYQVIGHRKHEWTTTLEKVFITAIVNLLQPLTPNNLDVPSIHFGSSDSTLNQIIPPMHVVHKKFPPF